jgi:hypothetical protein
LFSSAPTRIAAVAAAALLLAGCSTINPITTTLEYEPSDGFSVDIGDNAEAMNLLVITSAVGEPAILTGSIYNADVEDLEVSFSIDGETFTDVTVPAQSTAILGPDYEVITGAATVAPGMIAQVLVNSEFTGQFATPVPVMDGTLPEYAPVLEAIPAPVATEEAS